jgi:hypothetical protein
MMTIFIFNSFDQRPFDFAQGAAVYLLENTISLKAIATSAANRMAIPPAPTSSKSWSERASLSRSDRPAITKPGRAPP